MLHVDDGAEGFQAADVFDNGTSPDAAPPRKRDPRVSQASEQGANAEKTGAKAVDQLVGRCRAIELGGGEANAVRLPVDLNPKASRMALMPSMSVREGMLVSSMVSSLRRLAVISTRAEFFAPLTRSVPFNECPPLTLRRCLRLS